MFFRLKFKIFEFNGAVIYRKFTILLLFRKSLLLLKIYLNIIFKIRSNINQFNSINNSPSGIFHI